MADGTHMAPPSRSHGTAPSPRLPRKQEPRGVWVSFPSLCSFGCPLVGQYLATAWAKKKLIFHKAVTKRGSVTQSFPATCALQGLSQPPGASLGEMPACLSC